MSSSDAIHQSYKVITHNGFDIVSENLNGKNIEVFINPSDSEVFLYKMDPRASGFSLSH